MTFITEFDKVIENRIKFLEARYKCVISVYEQDGKFYMNVGYVPSYHIDEAVELTDCSDTKYAMASAMREHFVK